MSGQDSSGFFCGIDIGTECVKTLIMNEGREVKARAVIPTRGYFQDCIETTLRMALEEAKITREELAATWATGFGAKCVSGAAGVLSESASHSRGAAHHFEGAITVIDLGGREPHVIQIGEGGSRGQARSVRRCAIGVGTFLMFAARHLDVHPTRLEELAAAADRPAEIGSYCSVFAGSEILERLLEGATREEIALGCIRSVSERIFEIGGFSEPLVVTGGVAEYFPGVLKGLSELSGLATRIVPEPIFAGALGVALQARAMTVKEEGATGRA